METLRTLRERELARLRGALVVAEKQQRLADNPPPCLPRVTREVLDPDVAELQCQRLRRDVTEAVRAVAAAKQGLKDAQHAPHSPQARFCACVTENRNLLEVACEVPTDASVADVVELVKGVWSSDEVREALDAESCDSTLSDHEALTRFFTDVLPS